MTAHTPSARGELHRIAAETILGLLSGRQLRELRADGGATWADEGAPREPLSAFWQLLAAEMAIHHIDRRDLVIGDEMRERAATLLKVKPTSLVVTVFLDANQQLLRMVLQAHWNWLEQVVCEVSRHGRLDGRAVLSLRSEAPV